MAVDQKAKNRFEYILRTPKERRTLKKLLLSYQKNLEKEWDTLFSPSSDFSEDDRKLVTVLAEFSTKTLDVIDRLDQKTEQKDSQD